MAIALIFAAKGKASDTEMVIGLIFILVVVVVAIAIQASIHYDVVVRNGLPYCPRCNRKVTYRRDHCRACGCKYMTFGGPAVNQAPKSVNPVSGPMDPRILTNLRQTEEQRKQAQHELAQQLERVRERAAEKAKRRAERDKAYRAMGIEPGPLAWFQSMSDLKQAVILGLAIAIPVGGMMVLIFCILKPFSAP